jgi:transmembrane protein 231
MQFPVTPSASVCAVRAMLFFDIKLSLLARLHMQSLLYVSSSWSVPSHHLWIGGDLHLRQSLPLPNSGVITTYNVSAVNMDGLSAQDYEFVSILSRYQSRNITTALAGSSHVWEPGSNSTFKLEFEIRYPPQSISYRPGFWELMKFAWIQYLSVLVIFYLVFKAVSIFVFNNQIVRTVVSSSDVKTKHS